MNKFKAQKKMTKNKFSNISKAHAYLQTTPKHLQRYINCIKVDLFKFYGKDGKELTGPNV